jgi:hypothetical protein
MDSERTTWTESDFDQISWHDNHVHGIQILAGEYGSGKVVLDIDHIIEWICTDGSSCTFRIAPANLTFHEVTDLRIELDYASKMAGLTPFSIDRIQREVFHPLTGYRWTIDVNWPKGLITFQATGFTQELRGKVLIKDEQWLAPDERQ